MWRFDKNLLHSPRACVSLQTPMSAVANSALEDCNEKTRLLEEYRESVGLYDSAVSALVDARSRVTREAYRRLVTQSEQARERSEQARLVLEKHVLKHGC